MRFSVGTRVTTDRGQGEIVGKEFYSRIAGGTIRWLVLLDVNPLPELFDDGILGFWPNEMYAGEIELKTRCEGPFDRCFAWSPDFPEAPNGEGLAADTAKHHYMQCLNDWLKKGAKTDESTKNRRVPKYSAVNQKT